MVNGRLSTPDTYNFCVKSYSNNSHRHFMFSTKNCAAHSNISICSYQTSAPVTKHMVNVVYLSAACFSYINKSFYE